MIPKQELMALAAELQLQAHVVEKDYALGWFLAGISAHPVIGPRWVFKGGTCLKKCYFETYRFSEDLDFTLQDAEHLDEGFLAEVFEEVGDWVYDACGLQLPPETRKFEVFTNPRGTPSAQGRVGYRGPLGRIGDPPRIKLDLAADEVLVLTPVWRLVHHPYTDLPAEGIHVLSYSFEEVFAEKMRALAERQRPRDLYDVVHLYRRQDLQPDRAVVRSTLARKCEFKGIPVPTYAALADRPERSAIEVEWEQMLAHQLPTCPPFEEFWRELPEVFGWRSGAVAAPSLAAVPTGAFGQEAMDEAIQGCRRLSISQSCRIPMVAKSLDIWSCASACAPDFVQACLRQYVQVTIEEANDPCVGWGVATCRGCPIEHIARVHAEKRMPSRKKRRIWRRHVQESCEFLS